MNFNVILAVLQIKGIVTEEEAIKVAQHVEQAPQSTYYKDALFAIQELVKPAEPTQRTVESTVAAQAKKDPILSGVKNLTDARLKK